MFDRKKLDRKKSVRRMTLEKQLKEKVENSIAKEGLAVRDPEKEKSDLKGKIQSTTVNPLDKVVAVVESSLYTYFVKHTASIYADENLTYAKAYVDFRTLVTNEELTTAWTKICTTFIGENAPKQINIGDPVLKLFGAIDPKKEVNKEKMLEALKAAIVGCDSDVQGIAGPLLTYIKNNFDEILKSANSSVDTKTSKEEVEVTKEQKKPESQNKKRFSFENLKTLLSRSNDESNKKDTPKGRRFSLTLRKDEQPSPLLQASASTSDVSKIVPNRIERSTSLGVKK